MNDTDVAMKEWYCNHIQRIRNFARQHPSHALVEVNVQDPATAARLATLFGTDEKHWQQQNQNRHNPKQEQVVQKGAAETMNSR